MVTITIKNCNQCQLDGDLTILKKVYQDFRIKHPNAWHIVMYQKQRGNNWDGYIKYITEAGNFKIGLLGSVYNKLLEYGENPKIIDKRPQLGITPVIPKQVGALTLRKDQINALRSILFNKIGNTPFMVCSANLAVNFGKTLLFTAIHKAFDSKLNTILVLNDSDLFDQFKKEIPLLLPNEKVSFIQGNKVTEWSKFNVAMVQSLSKNLDLYQPMLSKMQLAEFDEADVIDNKTYQRVIQHLHNAYIRVGLSGTLYKGKLKKDLVHNMNVRSFIGDMVEEVKLIDQIKKGTSTKTIIKMIKEDYDPVGSVDTYPDAYKNYITDNPKSYEAVLKRVKYNLKYKRLPMLIITKYIPHCERLAIYLKKNLPELNIKLAHNDTRNRKQIMAEFRDGKFDMLVTTKIVFRGKNMPLLQYTCNASSMDAEELTIQLLGRSVRKHISKTRAYIDDIMFPGRYLSRHGKHRRNYYLTEGMKVINIPRVKKKKPKKK